MAKQKGSAQVLGNFRWIIPNHLAASAMPLAVSDVKKAGVETVVSLIPEQEQVFRDPKWLVEARAMGINFHTIGIPNHEAPTRGQLKRFLEIMDLAKGHKRKVLIHCVAGIGRTGTMASAYLMARQGMAFKQALETIMRGLEGVRYDLLIQNKKKQVALKAERVPLKEYLKDHPIHFPESQEQELFLKRVERNFRNSKPTRRLPTSPRVRPAQKPLPAHKRRRK